jgi:hypothetical protein
MRVGGGIKEDRPHIETAVVLVVEIVDITAQDKGAPPSSQRQPSLPRGSRQVMYAHCWSI